MSLRDLLRVDHALVLKAGRRAGTLRRDSEGCRFDYEPSYDGPPVAHGLPMAAGPVRTAAGAVPPYFAGLLPEGRRLTALQRAIKTSADDEFSLLLAIGHDAIGDVQVVARDGTPWAEERREPADISKTTFAALFEAVLGPVPSDRRGLPGVQPKISGGMVSLPLAWGGRPVILKLDPPDYPGVVENEALFLALAKDAGLKVPAFEVLRDAQGKPGLLVSRFDRFERADGSWGARAQEDACQVLGLYPADKYRPATEEVITALSNVCGAPRVAARELVRAVTFAYVTCNGDAHAKNFSVTQDAAGEWFPSPVYDVPSTHPYGDHTMALQIGGRSSHDIGRRDLIALAAAAEVPARAACRVIDAVATAVEASLPQLDALPYDARRIHKLRRAMLYRLERVRAPSWHG